MKIKLKWQHIFLCLIFGHKDYCHKEETDDLFPNLWKVCKRCARAELLLPPPPKHPNCLCILTPLEGEIYENQD